MSVYANLLAKCDARITSLGLSWTPEGAAASIPANVAVRKLPRVEEGLGDTLTLIAICPDDKPERIEPASAEEASGVWKWYRIEFVTIAVGNQDFVANMPELFEWREKMMRAFQDPRPIDVDELVDTEIIPDVPIDRSKLNANYDYSGFAVRFRCIEQRNNTPLVEV